MKITIKETAKKGDVNVVTPQTFRFIDWNGKEVSGLKYYVAKAVKLGAKIPEPTAPERLKK